MRFIFFLGLLCLTSCGERDPKNKIIIYPKDNHVYQKSIEMLRKDAPEYFEVLDESQIYGHRVFGKKVECVDFVHSTTLTVHIDVPLYCFDYETKKFLTKL